MTDQEKLAELRNRINEAAEKVVLMPVTRYAGSSIVQGRDMVAAIPIPVWDAILEVLDSE